MINNCILDMRKGLAYLDIPIPLNEEIMKFNGAELDGQIIIVRECTPMESTKINPSDDSVRCKTPIPGSNMSMQHITTKPLKTYSRRDRRKTAAQQNLDQERENKKKTTKTKACCNVCSTKLIKNNSISCKQCKNLFHIKCTGLTDVISDYYCMECMEDEINKSLVLETSLRLASDSEKEIEYDEPTTVVTEAVSFNNGERDEVNYKGIAETGTSNSNPEKVVVNEEEKAEPSSQVLPSQPLPSIKEKEEHQTMLDNITDDSIFQLVDEVNETINQSCEKHDTSHESTPLQETCAAAEKPIELIIEDNASIHSTDDSASESGTTEGDSDFSSNGNTDKSDVSDEEYLSVEDENVPATSKYQTPQHGLESQQELEDSEQQQTKSMPPIINEIDQITTNNPCFIESTDIDMNKIYQCTLCKSSSISIGGIKNHITRMHKETKPACKKPNPCQKCKKQIQQLELAGTCNQCGGMEHYKCTQTSRKYEEEYRNGSLKFKCANCCAPGVWNSAQNEDLENELNTQDNEDTEDAAVLKTKLQDMYEKYEAVREEAEAIAGDNEKLVTEMNVLRQDIHNLSTDLTLSRSNNKALATQCNDAKAKYKALEAEYRDLDVTYTKAQELALSNRNNMTRVIKDAERQKREKDEEIGKLIKIIEKIKAENITYASIMRNNHLSSQVIADRGVTEHGNRLNNYTNFDKVTDNQTSKEGHRVVNIRNQHTQETSGNISEKDQMSEYESDKNGDEYTGNGEGNISRERHDSHNHFHSEDNQLPKRYCHFFNRESGCTRRKCTFLHEIAPPCRDYSMNRCHRRFCMFTHPRNPSFQDGLQTQPAQSQSHPQQNQQHNTQRNQQLQQKVSVYPAEIQKEIYPRNQGFAAAQTNTNNQQVHIQSYQPTHVTFRNMGQTNQPFLKRKY